MLQYNVNMTPAIMSRFDLFFVVVDECDEISDYNIARHIVSLHQRVRYVCLKELRSLPATAAGCSDSRGLHQGAASAVHQVCSHT